MLRCIVLLSIASAALAEPKTVAMPSNPIKEGKAEYGHGLTERDALEGQISLFDGTTTFGWNDAKVVDGAIAGRRTTSEFSHVRVHVRLVKGGKIKVGTKESTAKDGQTLTIKSEGKGPIVLGDGVSVSRLVVQFDAMKSIMPGGDLKGWKRIDRATTPEEKRPKWTMKNGIVEAVGGPGALEYPTLYGNVAIQVEARSRNRHTNGGLFFRSIPGDFMNGYEAQIHSACVNGDPSKPAEYATGGIDDRQNARRLVSRDFEPFVMTVLADGPHIATWVNGYQVTDWTDTRKAAKNPRQGLRLEAGTIQLQAHDPATDLEFRAIRVVELK